MNFFKIHEFIPCTDSFQTAVYRWERGSSVSRILYIRLSFFICYKQLYVMLDSFE